MKALKLVLLSAALTTLSFTAVADPDKDESGHGKRHGQREHKAE
jgi:hypothetical protein